MPDFTSYEPGTPCWVDLMSADIDGAKAFYSAVFGWDAVDQFDDEGNRIYVNFRLDGKEVAGLGGQPPGAEGMPSAWNTYIATDDCEAVAAKVTEAGGSVMMPPMQVMDAGSMAIFADPSGAAFSVWQAGEHVGAQIANEPNTYSWNELQTRDLDAAKPFYSQVFGWDYDVQDMGPMGEYVVIKGGAENQGMGGLDDHASRRARAGSELLGRLLPGRRHRRHRGEDQRSRRHRGEWAVPHPLASGRPRSCTIRPTVASRSSSRRVDAVRPAASRTEFGSAEH